MWSGIRRGHYRERTQFSSALPRHAWSASSVSPRPLLRWHKAAGGGPLDVSAPATGAASDRSRRARARHTPRAREPDLGLPAHRWRAARARGLGRSEFNACHPDPSPLAGAGVTVVGRHGSSDLRSGVRGSEVERRRAIGNWERLGGPSLRRLVLLGVVAVVLSGAAGARSNPPALRVSDVTAEATGPSGADATYTVKAFDPGTGTPLAATCDTPSGTAGTGSFDVTAHFPVGATPVSCETTTLDATPVTESATVT